MLNYILELTNNLVEAAFGLSEKDKRFIYDEVAYAVNQTKSHIATTRENGRDRQSPILSNIWQRTSHNIGKIANPRINALATTMQEKSKYWANPDGYDTSQFEEYQMRITQVENTLANLCK